MNLEIPSIQLRHRSWDSMTHDTCTRLASCCCRKSPAEKAIQVHTGQMSSKTIIIGLSIFRCGNECTSQITEDFASWCKLKTFRRSLNKISTFRANLIISRLRMFNHASLALKLNTQNANGSIIDVQWFKSSFGVSFFICSRLATTS